MSKSDTEQKESLTPQYTLISTEGIKFVFDKEELIKDCKYFARNDSFEQNKEALKSAEFTMPFSYKIIQLFEWIYIDGSSSVIATAYITSLLSDLIAFADYIGCSKILFYARAYKRLTKYRRTIDIIHFEIVYKNHPDTKHYAAMYIGDKYVLNLIKNIYCEDNNQDFEKYIDKMIDNILYDIKLYPKWLKELPYSSDGAQCKQFSKRIDMFIMKCYEKYEIDDFEPNICHNNEISNELALKLFHFTHDFGCLSKKPKTGNELELMLEELLKTFETQLENTYNIE